MNVFKKSKCTQLFLMISLDARSHLSRLLSKSNVQIFVYPHMIRAASTNVHVYIRQNIQSIMCNSLKGRTLGFEKKSYY